MRQQMPTVPNGERQQYAVPLSVWCSNPYSP